MKKTIPYTIIFLSIISIVITHIMPFNVIKADSSYYVFNSPCDNVAYYQYSSNSYRYFQYKVFNYTSEIRAVYYKYSSNRYDVFLISKNNFQYINSDVNTSTSACQITTTSGDNAISTVINNETYYYTKGIKYEGSSYHAYNFDWYIPEFTLADGLNELQSAIYYTFGDGAVSPIPPISHGDLKVGYSTDFVSNGNGVSGYNRDNITWDNYDANGNLLDDLNYSIELRAVPGYYEGTSLSQLIAQTVVNFTSGYAMQLTNGAVNLVPFEYYTLWRGTPNKKSLSFTWAEVVNHFDIFVDTVKAGQYGDKFYKSGWRYEIRYTYHEPEDDDYYESPWQIIYQVTSSAPSTSENIYNALPNGISPELYNLLQTVNTLNNTVQNWNINGVPLQIQPTGSPTQDGSWIEKLIEAITTIVGKIVDVIGGIFNTLISDLAELVNNLGVNILDFFTNIINTITSNNDAIDLTLPEFNLDSDSLDALGEFKELTNAYTDIFINSGLWFVIVVPLVIFLLRVVF